MTASDDNPALEGETTELLQQLIKNACVNDGSPASGQEVRSTDVLANYLEDKGLDIETYESAPGRKSLVARIEGRDPEAPTLMLMGHTDVVPANADRWERDPFGGELVDGEVWGRGAVDMLNLTASMAVATGELARQGFSPDGTLIYLAVADEEALGTFGAEHLVAHEAAAVNSDFVITESGGIPIPSPGGVKLPVIVGEKGCYWSTLRVRGTAGHGSQPYNTDNALVKAAEIVRRIERYRPQTQIHDIWRRFIESMDYPQELTAPLLSPETLFESLAAMPTAMARQFHACTHMTLAPTVIHGGSKVNTIPDVVDLQIDVRTLPGQEAGDVREAIAEALGDLADEVEIIANAEDPSTASPVDTPLWHALAKVTKTFYEGSQTIPFLTVGATDARFFRRVGATAYGFGLFSTHLSFEDYGSMFHGDNERVDVESLRLSTDLWHAVAHEMLGR